MFQRVPGNKSRSLPSTGREAVIKAPAPLKVRCQLPAARVPAGVPELVRGMSEASLGHSGP